jgi:NitT/TauT family transport system permease protein
MENVCKQALIPRTPTPYVTQLKASAADNTISLISFIAFLIAWELICRLGVIGPYQLVPPSQLVTTFILKLTSANPDGGTLFEHTETSLILALTGFGTAVIIGVPLGLFMGWYKPLDIPLAIIWLGIGLPAKAFIIWLAAFVPCVINSYTGIKLTNPVLIRVAQIYGASSWETFYKIGVPSAIPMVFTGLKLSLNASWTTLVAAELLAASQGLGYLIQMGRRLSRPDIIIVGMLTIGFTGALMSWGLNRIEARFASSKRVKL